MSSSATLNPAPARNGLRALGGLTDKVARASTSDASRALSDRGGGWHEMERLLADRLFANGAAAAYAAGSGPSSYTLLGEGDVELLSDADVRSREAASTAGDLTYRVYTVAEFDAIAHEPSRLEAMAFAPEPRRSWKRTAVRLGVAVGTLTFVVLAASLAAGELMDRGESAERLPRSPYASAIQTPAEMQGDSKSLVADRASFAEPEAAVRQAHVPASTHAAPRPLPRSAAARARPPAPAATGKAPATALEAAPLRAMGRASRLSVYDPFAEDVGASSPPPVTPAPSASVSKTPRHELYHP